jgi:hypothetical protein
MKETALAAAENKNYTKTAATKYGELQYDRLGGDEQKNPILLFPGFPLGTTALRPFAEALNTHGRTVIAPNKLHLQPNHIKPTFDKEAELLAQIIEQEGLQDTALDIVAHSNGALLFEAVAKLADERGWQCFQQENGAHSILVAPTGTNSTEKIWEFVPRYLKFLQLGPPRDKVLDADKKLLKQNAKALTGNLRKSAGEIRPILTKKIDYTKLGKIASKPSIMQYPKDPLYPYKVLDKTVFPNGLESDEGLTESVSTPVKVSEGLGQTLEQMALGSKPSRDDKEKYYRLSHTARHDDLVFNPESTAEAVLQILDGPEARLEKLRQI